MKSFPFLNATLRRLTLLCLLVTACFSTVTAQDTTATRMHEVGLQITNFNLENFALIYKVQNRGNENRYTRYRFIFTNINFFKRAHSDVNAFSFNLGGSIGIEKRTNLSDRIQFIYGPEFNTLFRYRNSDSGDSQNPNAQNETNVSLGLGYILGLQYNFDSRFYINLEIAPGVSANYNTSKIAINDMENKNTEWSAFADFNFDAVALTFAYRFGTTKK